jgi:hypothetical protein
MKMNEAKISWQLSISGQLDESQKSQQPPTDKIIFTHQHHHGIDPEKNTNYLQAQLGLGPHIRWILFTYRV